MWSCGSWIRSPCKTLRSLLCHFICFCWYADPGDYKTILINKVEKKRLNMINRTKEGFTLGIRDIYIALLVPHKKTRVQGRRSHDCPLHSRSGLLNFWFLSSLHGKESLYRSCGYYPLEVSGQWVERIHNARNKMNNCKEYGRKGTDWQAACQNLHVTQFPRQFQKL